VLHPEERDFVFIAGGIGITPFMSMIRHMVAEGSQAPVLLLFANKTEEDIVFQQELEQLRREGRLPLEIVYILERPPAGWGGETGLITRRLIERHAGSRPSGKAFYVCGPPAMMDAVIPTLRRMGVPRRSLHSERFAL
jgi:ferredoxin-NADP reductase